ncbi:hypothetical protein Mal64_21690 [Pseudobythopirellula maris]|uniref:Uncharacterized protein n=1 Tax=Pseudobythopirellula maris TaxID=2527991 RepID=A0A5C5ZMJ4_9BACT|nr:hypothetical protein [Pseudobythopirellula maris]TWT88682.1 hypothetical protein Mal64_21690 [Pseudobythopirellula maris]
MSDLLAPCFLLLALGLLALMVYQGLKRQVELLSVRNLYLGGFIVYQLYNPAVVVSTQMTGMFQVERINSAASVLLGYACVFIPCFLIAYHYGVGFKWLARKISPKATDSSDYLLLTLSLCISGAVILIRLAPPIPVISSVLYHLSIGLAAIACGMIGWVWAKRSFNPLVVAVGLLVFSICMGVAIWGAFGRRSILAVGFGLVWGVYYRYGRNLNPLRVLIWTSPMLLATLLVVSAFTAMRGETRAEGWSLSQTFKSMTQSDASSGAKDVLSGQTCGSAAMWCVENYPRPNEMRHLFSLRQMVIQFVPRMMWEDKPKPLANDLASLAQIQGVDHSKITLPPGVLGYAAAEGGIYAAIVYAVFFGGFVRLFDELISLNIDNPYIVLATGSCSGHFLGLARGDIANFTINIVVTFVGSLLILYVLSKLLGKPVQRYAPQWSHPAGHATSRHYQHHDG